MQEQATRIALEENFDPAIVHAVIETETGGTWNCSRLGLAGELGCLQIIPEYHEVDPLDFEASVRYFISSYKKGYSWWWTGCSCIQTAKVFGVKVKGDAKNLIPNAGPEVGNLVLLKYGSVSHVAVIRGFTVDGDMVVKEGNYIPCKITSRTISFSDTNIVGYWSVESP